MITLQSMLAPLSGCVLVTVLGWQAGAIVGQSFSQQESDELSNRVVEAWLMAGQRPQVAPRELAYDHLFVEQEKAPEPAVVPKTPLKMVLSAVFVAPDNVDSGAIIATLNTNASYYKVGDEVESGIYLKSVHDDHVVLDRNGSSEALYFKEFKGSGGLSSVAEPRVQARVTPSLPVRSASEPVQPKAVRDLPQTELGGDIRRLNAAAFMRKYQQKMQEDPSALLSEAGITPATGGGYRLGDSPYASLLTAAGLEMGDVILSVNGSQLGDPQSDAQLLGKLSQQNEVEVMIKRGSRQFAVTFPISR